MLPYILYTIAIAMHVLGVVIIKKLKLTGIVTPLDSIYIRTLFSIIILTPFVLKNMLEKYRQISLKYNILGGLAYTASVYCLHVGASNVPVNWAIIIGLLSPFMVIILAHYFLHEQYNKKLYISLFLCFISSLAVYRIYFISMNFWYVVLLIGALCYSISSVTKKHILKTQSTISTMYINLLVVLPIAFFVCNTKIPTATLLIPGSILTFCYFVEFLLMHMAFKQTDAGLLQPIRFTKLPSSILLSLVLLGEYPTLVQIIASVVIIGSNLFFIRK